MIEERKGAAEWTIGKLMTLILLVLLVVLVIVGLSTQAFNPIYERVEGAFNSVMVFMGWKVETPINYDKEVEILGVGSGILRINPATKECKIDLYNNLGSYKIDFVSGEFMSYEEIIDLQILSSTRQGLVHEGYTRKGLTALEYSSDKTNWEVVEDAQPIVLVDIYGKESIIGYTSERYGELSFGENNSLQGGIKHFIGIEHEVAEAIRPEGISDSEWQEMQKNAKIKTFLDSRCR